MKHNHGGTEARRRIAGLVLACAVLTATQAAAEGWEIEASLGGYIGSNFTRKAPFEYRGLEFEPLYRTCDLSALPPSDLSPVVRCRQVGAADVLYALERRFTATGIAGLELRRRLGDSFGVGVGALTGLAGRRDRLSRQSIGGGVSSQVTLTAPLEPDTLFETLQDSDFTAHYTGVGTLAYLHAGFRYERGFERRTTTGYRASSVRVFVDGGGGILPMVPGGDETGLGTPPAFHVGAGLRFRRLRGAFTLSVLHVRSLGDPSPTIIGPHFRWTGFRVGWVWAR